MTPSHHHSDTAAVSYDVDRARLRVWGCWKKWTVGRAFGMVAFAALILGFVWWQVLWSLEGVSFALMGDQQTMGEARASGLHLGLAILAFAALAMAIGWLRGRVRWLVVAAVLVIAAAYVCFGPIDPESVQQECTPQTCPDFSPRPDDVVFPSP